jgi:hypothetical protein
MLEYFVEKLLGIFDSIPALFLEKGSPHFSIVRTMFAIIFVVGVLFVIALWHPSWTDRVTSIFTRKKPP